MPVPTQTLGPFGECASSSVLQPGSLENCEPKTLGPLPPPVDVDVTERIVRRKRTRPSGLRQTQSLELQQSRHSVLRRSQSLVLPRAGGVGNGTHAIVRNSSFSSSSSPAGERSCPNSQKVVTLPALGSNSATNLRTGTQCVGYSSHPDYGGNGQMSCPSDMKAGFHDVSPSMVHLEQLKRISSIIHKHPLSPSAAPATPETQTWMSNTLASLKPQQSGSIRALTQMNKVQELD